MGRVLSQLDESGVRMWNAVSKKVVQAKNLLKSPRKGTENEKKNPKAEQVKKAKKQLGQYGISSNSSSEGVKKYKSLKSSAGSSAPKTSKLSGAFCDELVALLKDTPESNETLISKLKGLLSEVINENALGNWSKSDRSAFIKLTAALGEDGAFFNRGDWNEFSVVMRQHSEIQKRLDATNLKKKNNMAESPIGSHGSKSSKVSLLTAEFCKDYAALVKKSPTSKRDVFRAVTTLVANEMNRGSNNKWSKEDSIAFLDLNGALQSAQGDEKHFDVDAWKKFSDAMNKHPDIQETLRTTLFSHGQKTFFPDAKGGSVYSRLPPESCEKLGNLFHQHDIRTEIGGEQYIPGENGFIFIQEFLVYEAERNPFMHGWIGEEKKSFVEMSDCFESRADPEFDIRQWDKVWIKFRSTMENNAYIKNSMKCIQGAEGGKKELGGSSSEVSDGVTGKPVYSGHLSDMENLYHPIEVKRTQLSNTFCRTLVHLFLEHDKRRKDDGSAYIPGELGMPYVRTMIEAEKKNNPGLEGWNGKERKTFEKVIELSTGKPLNIKEWDKAWIDFRNVMAKHKAVKYAHQQIKNEGKGGKPSQNSSVGSAMPKNPPSQPGYDIHMTHSAPRSKLSSDFIDELAKMFCAHAGLSNPGTVYIPGIKGTNLVVKMINREAERINKGMAGWRGEEKVVFNELHEVLRMSYDKDLWKTTWMAFREVMMENPDVQKAMQELQN
jgi:hypothetical protein